MSKEWKGKLIYGGVLGSSWLQKSVGKAILWPITLTGYLEVIVVLTEILLPGALLSSFFLFVLRIPSIELISPSKHE